MSEFRRMRLTPELAARCHRVVADPGPPAHIVPLADDDFAPAARKLLEARRDSDVWLFAYGSLIWKPEIAHVAQRRATAQGWHRAFSMKIVHVRGSVEQPGYMMCLDSGGSCEGIVLQLPAEELEAQIEKLLRREVIRAAALDAVRWIDVATDEGPLQALAFYARPDKLDNYAAGRPLAEIAHGLARACGHWGSGADYLYNTVSHLEALGIHDQSLWALQELVAREIEAL